MKMISEHDTLRIKSRTDQLARVRSWLTQKAQKWGLAPEDIYALTLAVTEACANIIRHAYEGAKSKDIILSISTEENKLAITIRDFGKKFNLAHYTPPDPGSLAETGYGVYLILNLMDEVEYDTSPLKGTVLRMSKYKARKR